MGRFGIDLEVAAIDVLLHARDHVVDRRTHQREARLQSGLPEGDIHDPATAAPVIAAGDEARTLDQEFEHGAHEGALGKAIALVGENLPHQRLVVDDP